MRAGRLGRLVGSGLLALTVVGLPGMVAAAPASPAAGGSPGVYTPLAPTRICDTRVGDPSGLSGAADQCAGKSLRTRETLTVSVAGRFGVPAEATAVVTNVTAVVPKGSQSGYVTVFPAGETPPTASNLNVNPSETVANLVHVGVGTSGAISVFSSAAIDVVVDVEGYLSPGAVPATGEGLYVPLPGPIRICDSRAGDPSRLSGPAIQCNTKPLAAAGTVSVAVAGKFAVPVGATAVVANVTAVSPASEGYLTGYPTGTVRPTASNVNYTAGQIVPNRVIVAVGVGGAFDVYSSSATNVVVDISGYYTAAGGTGGEDVPAATPTRVCDTRTANPSALAGVAAQCNGRPIGPGQALSVNVAGQFGIPANATAVIVDVVGIAPSAQTYVTVFPSGAPPLVSDLNLLSGQIQANLVVATISATGSIELYNDLGTTNVAIDVTGWEVPPPAALPSGPAPLSIATTSVPAGTLGQPYPSTILAASGGTRSYTWSAMGLPAGLTLSAAGVLSGTPTVPGVAAVSVNVRDSASGTAARALALTIEPAGTYTIQRNYEAPLYEVYGVSCGSSSECTAVGQEENGGGAIVATHNGGTTWTHQTVPVGTSVLIGVSCTSGSDCTAVGNQGVIVANDNGGATWTTQTSPAGTAQLDGVSCSSASDCVAVGTSDTATAAIVATTNGGATWTNQVPPAHIGPASLNGVACSSVSDCTAVGNGVLGGVILATNNGGATWTYQTIPTGTTSLGGVSCSPALNCTAVGNGPTGGVILATTDGGITWRDQTIPPGSSTLRGVSCTSSSDCTAVGQSGTAASDNLAAVILATTNGGATWASHTIPTNIKGLEGISCTSGSKCTAGGYTIQGTGVTATTTNGGATWTDYSIPGIGVLNGVSCPSHAVCTSVGMMNTDTGADAAVAVATADGGATWTSQTLPADIEDLFNVSCSSALNCTAVGLGLQAGGGIASTTDGGATWHDRTIPVGISKLGGVSCASPLACTAVGRRANGAVILATTDGGTTWNAQTIPIGITDLGSVSCSSVSDCTAVGYGGSANAPVIIATTDGGATWSAQTTPTGTTGLASVSCSSAADCTAVGQAGPATGTIVATTDGGATWTAQTIPRGIYYVNSVSCTSAGICTAVAGSQTGGTVLATANGGAIWNDKASPARIPYLYGVSCTSGHCVAVGNGGALSGGVILNG